jgi:hypothetical protein
LAVQPKYQVTDEGMSIEGVSADCPVIYDNDWWTDVPDAAYVWAKASLGECDLRGNVITRCTFGWETKYAHQIEEQTREADRLLKLARDSGLRNIPDPVIGAREALRRPPSGRDEDTKFARSPGSDLIVAEARKASPEKPLLLFVGGSCTTVATAWLTDPSIAGRVVVFQVDGRGYNGSDGWAWDITIKHFRFVNWARGYFWEHVSTWKPDPFNDLPKNPLCDFLRENAFKGHGKSNQWGDGTWPFWLFDRRCVTAAEPWEGAAITVPKSGTNVRAMEAEFFRTMADPRVYAAARNGATTPCETVDDGVVYLAARWQKGDQFRLNVERRREDFTGAEKTSDRSSKLHADVVVLEAGEDGYVLAWTWRGRSKPLTDLEGAAQQPEVLLGGAGATQIEVVIDADANVRGVRNWEAVRAAMKAQVEGMTKSMPAAQRQEARAVVADMLSDPARGQHLVLREIPLLLAPIGRDFRRDEPQEFETKLPNPFGGEPFPAKGKYTLTEFDPATSRAEVDFQQAVDPERATAAMEKVAKDLADGAKPKAPGGEKMPPLVMTDRATFVVDASKGWPLEMRHQRRVHAGDRRRVDTLVIKTEPQNDLPEASKE